MPTAFFSDLRTSRLEAFSVIEVYHSLKDAVN